jgi:hypothetical protein
MTDCVALFEPAGTVHEVRQTFTRHGVCTLDSVGTEPRCERRLEVHIVLEGRRPSRQVDECGARNSVALDATVGLVIKSAATPCSERAIGRACGVGGSVGVTQDPCCDMAIFRRRGIAFFPSIVPPTARLTALRHTGPFDSYDQTDSQILWPTVTNCKQQNGSQHRNLRAASPTTPSCI